MKYPTLEEVDAATQLQLARWYRFLPSPGESHMHLEHKQFEAILLIEETVLMKIIKNFKGFTPELSKEVGWG